MHWTVSHQTNRGVPSIHLLLNAELRESRNTIGLLENGDNWIGVVGDERDFIFYWFGRKHVSEISPAFPGYKILR